MALSLKIPALEDKPLISAETRTYKITQFIQALPATKPLETASLLLEEMQVLNRQKVAPDSRVKALEVYRPALTNITENLTAQFWNAPLPLSANAKKYAAAAESLWLELGYGYKLALIDQQSKLFSLSSSKFNALVVTRALEAISQLAMVYYHTYSTLPSSVWGDLHQLYLFAVQQSLQDIEVSTDGVHKQSASASLTYKQALLMSLADPQHLAPNDIRLVADYIKRNAGRTQLQGLGLPANPAGIFLINLDSENPPIPYVKNKEEVNASTDILFITVDLARLVHKHIQSLQAGEPVNTAELPENATDPRYQDILTYLIKHWGTTPKRVFNRSRKSDGVQLGIGIAATHYFISGENYYVGPSDPYDLTEITTKATGNRAHKASSWQVLNISAGGMALRKLPNAEVNVRVGELLSVKNGAADNWSVGVLRWLNNNEQQLDVGAQLIAPEAQAAGARIVNQSRFEPVLILPGLDALKQAPSMVAACGTYGPARVLELEEDGKISRIMITRLVERTGSFERFNFSYL